MEDQCLTTTCIFQVGQGSLLQAPLDDDAGRSVWVKNWFDFRIFLIVVVPETIVWKYFFDSWTSILFCRVTESLCDSQTCPIDLITPPDDCHVNYTLSFSLQVRVSLISSIWCVEFCTRELFILSIFQLWKWLQCFFLPACKKCWNWTT